MAFLVLSVLVPNQAFARHPEPRANLEVINGIDVGPGQERINVPVGVRKGRFRAIAVLSNHRPVFLREITIRFGNGQRQAVRIDRWLDEGELSKIIDLRGERRKIKSIVLQLRPWRSRRTTRVQILADRAGPPLEVINTVRFNTGERRVVIPVGRQEGRFRGLALRALDRSLRLREVEVVYGNGKRQYLRVGQRLDVNDTTEVLKLRGERRFIRRVIVHTRPLRGRGRARIQLLGLSSGGPGPVVPVKEKWVLLGSQRAGLFKKDHDVFYVGKQKGRFRAIRVTAKKHDIRMYGMKIIYGNGYVEEVGTRGILEDGRSTSPYDLKGSDRYIESIHFQYKTRLNFKGTGFVEVWGLKVQ